MDFSDHATLTYALLAIFSVSALAFLLSQPTDFAKWVQKKKYQYEVTFALYMLTPTEKFVFNSVLFLFVAMTSIAAALYLPDHIMTIARRAFYYWAGEGSAASNATQKAAETVLDTATKATAAVVDTVTGLAEQAAANGSAAAQEGLVR